MSWFNETNGTMDLNVRVIPRASKNSIQGIMGDALKVRLQAPPVDGKANMYLIKYLSKSWKIPRGDIEILSGTTGRNKRLRIHNPTDRLRKTLLSIGNG